LGPTKIEKYVRGFGVQITFKGSKEVTFFEKKSDSIFLEYWEVQSIYEDCLGNNRTHQGDQFEHRLSWFNLNIRDRKAIKKRGKLIKIIILFELS